DATWFAEYYHQLIGDATNDPSRARLLKFAGYGDDRALNVSWFAGTLANTVSGRVVYHESHDEAGNSHYQEGGTGRLFRAHGCGGRSTARTSSAPPAATPKRNRAGLPGLHGGGRSPQEPVCGV